MVGIAEGGDGQNKAGVKRSRANTAPSWVGREPPQTQYRVSGSNSDAEEANREVQEANREIAEANREIAEAKLEYEEAMREEQEARSEACNWNSDCNP
ncbi:hypothetical protein V6N13_105379 [Hibiscus sabdariffa]|uniref:Uncharacterized protein n=1 Tax=Hibiscus sabdariffa TaxID=183260 RepID=A0ABR2EWP7_9ROSI